MQDPTITPDEPSSPKRIPEMIQTKRNLFRTAALAHYNKTATEVSAATPALNVWRMIRLVFSMLFGLLATPFVFWRRRRVPVVLQMTTTQCGAACLTMVLRHLGHAISLTQVAEQMGIGRNGATALSIAQSARHFGLDVRGYSVEPADLPKIALPAIIHWSFSHFVVLEAWHPSGTATIVDPAEGRRTVDAAEFDRCFTGVVLVLSPGPAFQRRRTSPGQAAWRKQLHRLVIAGGAWRIGLKAFWATAAVQLAALALPLLMGVLVDFVVPQQQLSLLPVLAAGVAVVVAMQMALNLLRSLTLIQMQAELDTGLMRGFLEHLLSLPYRFFQQRTSGDLLMRLSSNNTMRDLLTTQTLAAMLDGLLVVGFLTVLLIQAPLFALITLVVGLIQVALLLASTGRMHELAQRHLATQAETQAYLVEALAGINVVKSTGAEDQVMERYAQLHGRALDVTVQQQRLSAMFDTLLQGLQGATPFILLLIGVQQVLTGGLTLGTMLALNALATGLLAPLSSLVTSGRQLQSVGAHLARLSDVLEAEPELQGPQQARLTGDLELRDIHFQYDRHSAPTLHNINVKIHAGQKVAIVGRSGSGKSTLARLILGLHEPTEGTVLFDDMPLNTLDRRSVLRHVGVVTQEVFLFSGSIRRNIAFGQEELSMEEILEAARLACIDRDIALMPMNLETLVAEGGAGLSGGQRQRLALARALARKPAILLLDEATSHLDTATEQAIEQNLRNVGCTQIVIAHRLSTVRNADLILVMDEGQIVEQGTHAQLLARDGVYAMLIANQD